MATAMHRVARSGLNYGCKTSSRFFQSSRNFRGTTRIYSSQNSSVDDSTRAMSEKVLPPPSLLKPITVPEKLLMGPGPSNSSPRIRAAGALPLLGHLHPEFTQIMDEVKEGIKYAFQTKNEMTLAVSGTGHAGMECAVVNMVEPGDVVLVAVNGIWGERFASLTKNYGGDVRELKTTAGKVFSLEEFEKALKEHKPSMLFVTHGESSTGTVQPLEGLGDLCHRYNCLLLVDTVASLGGTPFLMDEWNVDIVYGGSQKVLSVPPGTSPISVGHRARAKLDGRKTKVPSFYFDLNQLGNYWGLDGPGRRYHHTGPIASIYALREGLAEFVEEGLEECVARHQECANQLYDGLKKMGLEPFVEDKAARLPTVTTIKVPSGVEWKAVADYLMKNYRIEISGGLGPTAGQVWRIGLMGYNAQPEKVRLVLRVLEEAIKNVSSQSASKL